MREMRVAEALIERAISGCSTAGVGHGNESDVRNERYFDRSSNRGAENQKDGDASAVRHDARICPSSECFLKTKVKRDRSSFFLCLLESENAERVNQYEHEKKTLRRNIKETQFALIGLESLR